MPTSPALLPLCAAAALLVAGAAPTRAEPAPSSELDIPFEKYTLDNGLEVILHPDPRAPLVAVNVWYHVGSGDETPGKSGFAHLFEHMMFQGTKHTGEDVHFPILEAIGASAVNGTTNSDRTNYYETVPRHELETALWLESDRMGYLLDALTEKSFRNQVDVVRNERRQRYDNVAYGKARFVVAASLYPEGHPYRYMTIGRHEDLEAASLDDVRGFFRTWYVPSNATLTIAGDFDPTEVKALVVKWFGSFPKLPKPERRAVAPPEISASTTEVPDTFAKLEQIQRNWIGPKPLTDEALALEAALTILGNDGWGRLYKRLVVTEPLCQSVRVGIEDKQHNGELIVMAQLKPGADRSRVLTILDEELARIAKEPPSEAELRRWIVNTASDFVWALEDLAQRADQLQWFNHYAGDPGYASTYLSRVRAMTPDKVSAAAAAWLTKPFVQVVSVPAAAAPAPKPAPEVTP